LARYSSNRLGAAVGKRRPGQEKEQPPHQAKRRPARARYVHMLVMRRAYPLVTPAAGAPGSRAARGQGCPDLVTHVELLTVV